MWWFVDAAGQQQGPVDRAEINRLINSGHIGPDTPLWAEGWPTWKAASLAFAFPPPSRPSPPPYKPAPREQVADPRAHVEAGPRARRNRLLRLLDSLWARLPLPRYATWERVGVVIGAIVAILQGPTVVAEFGGTACEWKVPFVSSLYDCDGYIEKASGSLTAAYDGQLQDLHVAVMDGNKKTIDRLRRKGLKLRKDDFCGLFNVHYLDYLLGQSIDRVRESVSAVTSPDRVLALLPFADGMPLCTADSVTLVGESGERPFDRLALDIAATRSLMEGVCNAKADVMNERWSRAVTVINAIHANSEPSAAFREGAEGYARGLAEMRSAPANARADTCWISQTSGGQSPLRFTREMVGLCRNGGTSTAVMMAARFRASETDSDLKRKCLDIADKMSAPTPLLDRALSAWTGG